MQTVTQEQGIQSSIPAPGDSGRVNPNKALWEKGDFTRIARTMRASGEELVSQIGITPGMKVLDLGCGDGTTAIPAARLGAQVTGVDIARNLVAAGNRRAAEAGVADHCTFLEGDACDLAGIESRSFDRVISIFGAMFAPRPFDVAREMVRVTRPGGQILMGNWIANDPSLVAQLLRISSAYAPKPPEGFVSPMTWGSTPHIIERFGAAGIAAEAISWSRSQYVFEFDGPPEAFVEVFASYYGPTMNAFAAAAQNGREQALRDELVTLFKAQNQSQYPDTTLMAATFLKVIVDVG